MREFRFAALGAVLMLLVTPAATLWAESDRSETYRQLKLFGDVFERVRADYVEEVSDEDLIESAIRGMLSSLDPHSSYLDEKSFGDMQVQTRGEFGGLGIEVTLDENGLVKVVSPIDDTPAFEAGIQAGDYITHLDGEAVLGLTLPQAVDRMRGPVNTDIVLTVRREGRDAFDVTITRDIITIQSVRGRVEGNVGYVRITTFNEQTKPGLEQAIERFKKELGSQLIGYVIDLRNNPGGLLDQAIAVSDAFLDKGEIVSTRGRDTEEGQRFNSRPGDLAEGLPIVVLINSGSASASEIVAGALQDHRRAIVLGTASFGKGSVQTIIPMPGHGAMRLTTSRYYTPSGRSIQAKGIEPDIEVNQARIEETESRRRSREADLRGALENPEGGRARPERSDDDAEEAPAEDGTSEAERPQDYQLTRALDLLRGLRLFSERVVN